MGISLAEWINDNLEKDEEILFMRDYMGVDMEIRLYDCSFKFPRQVTISISKEEFDDVAIVASILQARKMIVG